MEKPSESWSVRTLKRFAAWVYARRGLFFYPHIFLTIAAVYYTATNLEFSTSRNDLVGADKTYHRNYLRFKAEFGGQDDLVAIVESEDKEKNRQFVERLGARLEKETNLFTQVFYKGDLKMLGPKALLFLDEPTLRDLQRTMGEYRPFIDQFTRATNLNSLFQMVNRQFLAARRGTNAQTEAMIKAMPSLKRIVDQAADSLARPGTPPSPGVTALFEGGEQAEEAQYITFDKGRLYLVNARPKSEELAGEAVERLRELAFETQGEVPGLNVGVTGEPVLEIDEMKQSQADSTLASIISLVACALIFISSYSETGRPIKATICLVVGLCYTMGYTTLAVGHLNILTVTFLPILIGLAIDFGIHLITRYEEELRHGKTQQFAMEKAMVYTGLGIFTGCLTTAGAFFAMGITDFRGIQEMGIITGGGMVVCLVPMMTLLPVLLLRGKQNVLDSQGSHKIDRRARLEQLWLQRPLTVTGITILLCLLSLTQWNNVPFDYNLLHMQSKGLPAVEFEHKLINSSSGKSVLYAAVIADNPQQALHLEQRLTNLVTVHSVDSMARFLVGDQSDKLTLISAIKADLKGIRFPAPDPAPADIDALSLTLWSLHGYLGLAIEEVKKAGEKQIEAHLTALRQSIEEFRHRMSRDPAKAAHKLAAFQQALFRDLAETFTALQNQDDRAGLRIQDLPEVLRNRFIGKTGKYLLQVYPKQDVWQRENQEAFVRELRTVDPNVTGTPIQLYEYTTLLKESYQRAAWYALGAIVILVFIHFRSLSCVILALLPVAIGMLWLVGMMGLFDVPFNPANIMILPLVIGIGVTNGVHILNRFAEEQNPSILAKSTGKAVLVSALTTIAGFASLIPAKHQGIASLGIVMSVGVGTCMLAALTFLPSLITLLLRHGWSMKKPSGDNALSTLGREEPR